MHSGPPETDAPESSRPTPVGGLSEWVERLADRLRSEFSLLLRELPLAARTPAAVTRHLKLKGPICFRLMGAIRSTGSAAEFYGAIPGPEGLERVLTAAKRAGVGEARVSAALAAIMDFEALLQQAGGSQRRLVAMLRGEAPERAPASARPAGSGVERRPTAPAGEGLAPADERQGVFEHMSRLLRCRMRGLMLLRICTIEEDQLEYGVVGAIGRVGFERHSQALPIVVRHGPGAARLASPPQGVTPAGGGGGGGGSGGGGARAIAEASDPLMAEFCSTPLPPAIMERRDGTKMYVIDPDNQRQGPMDVFVGPLPVRRTMWKSLGARGLNMETTAVAPTEWLVFDTYVQRSFAERCQAIAGGYLTGSLVPVAGDPRERWFDRLPGTVAPTILGPGLANAEYDRYARQRELTSAVFEAAGKDPDEYFGYRVVVEYPIMNIVYLLSLREEDGGALGTIR